MSRDGKAGCSQKETEITKTEVTERRWCRALMVAQDAVAEDGHTPNACISTRGHLHFRAMFETIRAELTTAADKLAHLRRFL
jgi:hypothetical protein